MGTMAEVERKVEGNIILEGQRFRFREGGKDQSYHVDLLRERLGGIRTQICCRS